MVSDLALPSGAYRVEQTLCRITIVEENSVPEQRIKGFANSVSEFGQTERRIPWIIDRGVGAAALFYTSVIEADSSVGVIGYTVYHAVG